MDGLLTVVFKRAYINAINSFSIVGLAFSAQSTYEKINPNVPFPVNLTFNKILLLFALSFIIFTANDIRRVFFKKIKIGTITRSVSIRTGNILARRNSTILVGVNDILTCDVNVIGQNSIHHQIIKKYHKTYGDSWIIDGFANEYEKCRASSLVDSCGHIPYGHCFKLSSPDEMQDYIFIVASTLQSSQVQTPITKTSDYKYIFDGLFQNLNSFRCKDNRLYLSLIGTGAAGNDVDKNKLIEYICFRFIRTPSDRNAVHDLVIMVRPKKVINGEIKLVSAYDSIEKLSEKCLSCPGDQSFFNLT